MKKLVIYFRKNTPCHKWIKCSKPVVGDWIMFDESYILIGKWNGCEIEPMNYEILMDYIYSEYVTINRDKKINKILK